MNDEPSTAESKTPPGWYKNPSGPGLRYWDGEEWTRSYHPGTKGPTRKEGLWALSLGFAATGAVGAVAIPLLAFYFPLGFGMGGAALGIAAATSEGESPWYAVLAVVACLVAIGTGINAYNEFNDTTQNLDDILRP